MQGSSDPSNFGFGDLSTLGETNRNQVDETREEYSGRGGWRWIRSVRCDDDVESLERGSRTSVRCS